MAKRIYYVKEGMHVEGGVTYKKGDKVESEHDLLAMFVNKFSTQPLSEDGMPAAEVVKEEKKEKEKKTPSTETEDKDERGEDVTAEFQDAVDNDLLVFTKGSWYYIFDPESDTPDVQINEKGIKKDAVTKSIDNYLD